MFKRVSKKSTAKRLFLGLLLVSVILIMVASSTVSYGQGTLSVQAKNTSNNSNANSVDFGQVPPETELGIPGQYIEIDYESDQSLWFIDIYTDNTNWNGGGYQRGGLVSSDGKQRVPLMWRVYDDVQPGGVVFSTTTDWAWLKDKGDQDIPNTPNDESWAKAFSDSYVNICYGGVGYTNLSPYPNTNPSPDVRHATSPIYVYLGGLFGSAGTGDYSTIISFDLYHLAAGPVISHKPIERIGIIGDKIVFNATITDNKLVESATIYYRIDKSGNWQSGAMALEGSPTEKVATYILGIQALSGPCEISYYLEASDNEGNISLWNNKSESSPQIIEVTQSITETVGPKGGKVILPDGNPDDGEIMVNIPEGALTKDTKITIEQITDLTRIPGYSEGGDWEPVALYNFTQEGIRFKKPVTMSLLYFDVDGDGYPEDWNGEKKEFNESQLACYWWDGFTWRPAGGRVDRERNSTSVNVTHLSYYGLFKIRPTGFSEYRPKERIITPACADGKNDVAYFSGLAGQSTIVRIYDITGKKIRTIEGEPYEWDGTDDDGNIVESGVYIYQFKADVEGKKRLVSGAIAVAK